MCPVWLWHNRSVNLSPFQSPAKSFWLFTEVHHPSPLISSTRDTLAFVFIHRNSIAPKNDGILGIIHLTTDGMYSDLSWNQTKWELAKFNNVIFFLLSKAHNDNFSINSILLIYLHSQYALQISRKVYMELSSVKLKG